MRAIQVSMLAALASLSACAVGPHYYRPDPHAPAEFAAKPAAGVSPGTDQAAVPPPDLAGWWHALNDAKLDALVDRAVKSNLDLKMALDRLQQARTYEAVVVGRSLPAAEASGAVAKGTGSDLTKGRADTLLRSADTGAGIQRVNSIGGFDAAWELDLFGKFRREFEAARADAQAAYAARNDVLTTVVADVVRAYIDMRGFQVRARILHQASDVLRDSLRIVNIRYQRGITNELDVALATRELNSVEAEIAPVEAQAKAAQYTLAVLLGEYPETMAQELAAPDVVPSMPAPTAPGTPLDLLKRRPDVQQSERELAAATARIGVATADLYPSVVLSGAIGAQAQGLGAPDIGRHIWSFGPGAVWPLLDFGTLDAQVEVADLKARASLDNYRSTILRAVQQVDTSLDAYDAERSRLDSLGNALVAGQRAVDLANQRYERGLTDFLNVVDAERQFYDLQEQYTAAQVNEGEQFVALYKSLGGGWENYQSIPSIRLPQPAVVAAFRRLFTDMVPRHDPQ